MRGISQQSAVRSSGNRDVAYAAALNVTMKPIDLQGWTLHQPPFPVDYWEPNEEKRIRMFGAMQSGPEIKVELFWKDQQGDNNKTLTVQTR